VERIFGVWKRLFPCLSMSIRTKRSTIPLQLLVATAVLYNFLRRRNDPIVEEPLEDADENPAPAINKLVQPLGNATRRALIIQHFT
jgi:hypothetical protein